MLDSPAPDPSHPPTPARRMRRDARREALLAAALDAFAELGYAEASNAEIARRAGLRSPGLLYHYFPTKLDLLRAVVQRHAPPLRLLDDADGWASRPLAPILREVGRAYVGFVRDPRTADLMRVLLGESVRRPEFAQAFGESGPMRLMALLARRLQQAMDEGELRRTDPELATRAFIGPFLTLALGCVVLRMPPPEPLDPDAFADQAVDLFLRGAEARP